MALAKGKSSIRCGPVTLHTDTAIHVAKQLTDVSNFLSKTEIIMCFYLTCTKVQVELLQSPGVCVAQNVSFWLKFLKSYIS